MTTTNFFRLQKEITTEPQTLIVGDGAGNEIKCFCSKKNTSPNSEDCQWTSDCEISHSHTLLMLWSNRSIEARFYWSAVQYKLRCPNTKVFSSGPLPTARWGDESFSRLKMLNRWLRDTCVAQTVYFNDNFNIFWERRHLLRRSIQRCTWLVTAKSI